MFYDERIERARGSIAKGAILIAFVVTAVLAPLHCANVWRNAPHVRYFWLVLPDVVILLSSMVTLLLGGVRRMRLPDDERAAWEQGRFYSRAATVLLLLAAGTYALALPIVSYLGKSLGFSDGGPSGVLSVLLFLVGIYVVYGFRKNDIYFNYSIMDSDRYYRGVLNNIGKLSLCAAGLLGISFVSLAGVVVVARPTAARVLGMLWAALTAVVGAWIAVVLLYLLYSFLEKCSYNSQNGISKSTMLSLGITILIYAVYTAGVLLIDSSAISQAVAVQLASSISGLHTYIKFALLIFLTYFGYEYQRARKNQLLRAACATILLSETLSVLIGQITATLIFVFMPEILSQDAYIIHRLFSAIGASVKDASSLAHIVGFALIIFALVKDKRIHRAHRLAVGALAVLGGVELFLRTQADILQVNIYHCIAEIVVLCYIACLVACAGRRLRQDLQQNLR